MHMCGICCRYTSQHDEECYEPTCIKFTHWPPLCCPGCACFSYEEEHGLPCEFETVPAQYVEWMNRWGMHAS